MKSIVKIILFVIAFGICFFFGWKSYKKIKQKNTAEKNAVQMPTLDFSFLKRGNKIDNRAVVINYFDPDCEHCQYMANEIYLNSKQFGNMSLIMVSSANTKRIL